MRKAPNRSSMLPAETRAEDRPAKPEYVTNWPAIYGALALAGVIGPGTLIGWLMKPAPAPRAEMDAVVRMADIKSIAPQPRAAALPLATTEEPSAETFRTEVVGHELWRPGVPGPVALLQATFAGVPQAAEPSLAGLQSGIQRAWRLARDVDLPIASPKLRNLEESQLLADLASRTTEVSVERNLWGEWYRNSKKRDDGEQLRALASVKELVGLPFRGAEDCHLDEASAGALRGISRDVRSADAATRRSAALTSPPPDRTSMVRKILAARQDQWKTPRHVGGLEQTLQVGDPAVREDLIKQLALIQGEKATAAIARRAVFDVNPRVRQKAVEALAGRARSESRPVLLAAFRHPWPAAAEHSAKALVKLDDREAVADLVELVDAPDPSAPRLNQAQSEMVVAELVKVNHLRNCALCHAPIDDDTKSAGVVGPIPTPGRELPVVYYSGSARGASGFVRADVTYLQQDFSLEETLKDQQPWPANQRMDYLVRERPFSYAEYESAKPAANLQRDSVLFALESLTGESGPASTRAWRERLSR